LPSEEIYENVTLAEGENVINNATLMAATSLIVLPVIALFAFLQKKFMQGIERTGLVE
jgi:ABC-type glycerol-3-phosphate transport system permease component